MPAIQRPKGLATRAAILRKAADLASVSGLSGLTIASLADSLAMSKSGLFAHFGSKEDLQLAAVEAAREVFEARVVEAAAHDDPGLARLRSLVEAWTRYVESGVFRGGCFFAAVSAEFDDRPGRIRDRVAELTERWRGLLQEQAEQARARGQIDDDADPAQIAFELHAFLHEANRAFQLHGSVDAFDRTRHATRRVLEQVISDKLLQQMSPK
ncbi:MAG: TetR/AcrR family transcriptional regulator [Deltaproteobacteria bacterium]|nr:TetR/AcrR family transcriptional regulator [Deltaproteobacteria bacterium]